MNFIFWQNIVSIHQSAFLSALAQHHNVLLVCAHENSSLRQSSGWNTPKLKNIAIKVSPPETEIKEIIRNNSNAHHIFSGIDAFPMVYSAFKYAAKSDAAISLMLEPYEWAGFKGALRRLKYTLHRLRFGNKISHIFTTGNRGLKCYLQSGFNPNKIHQWGYFTEQHELRISSWQTGKPNLIFIGAIIPRKNVLSLVSSVIKLYDDIGKFTIIGSGPLENELRQAVNGFDKIEFIGTVPNQEINKHLVNSDILILPSHFDGWGAVVNEALGVGTRVLCSTNCGAEILLDGEMRGGTFDIADKTDLTKQLGKWIEKGPVSNTQRLEIADWAKYHISGEVAADYFVKTIQGESIKAPWLT